MDTSLDRFYSKVFALDMKMPEVFISKLAFAVVSGLKFLINLNIMHRDVKPANILLNSTGEIRLCDFSISKFIETSIAKTSIGSDLYKAV
jgi:serine/threonine protein kinase